jgi:tryptophan synthase alpha chain
MNPIDALFQRMRRENRKAFLPFVTAGDPDADGSVRIAQVLAANGADLIEIGFPYSDPIADGPVIQASYTRALDRGTKLDDVFRVAGRIAGLAEVKERQIPLAAMSSYSLIHRRGAERFLKQAADAGISGAIVPDLPLEESEALARLAAERDFKLIQLVTPATPRDRAALIARRSTGFLYCVSVVGITGERERLPPELLDQLAWLRTQTDLPLCVGFGVSRPEHVRMLRDAADGVIVASALMRKLEQTGARPFPQIIGEIGDLARTLREALALPT